MATKLCAVPVTPMTHAQLMLPGDDISTMMTLGKRAQWLLWVLVRMELWLSAQANHGRLGWESAS